MPLGSYVRPGAGGEGGLQFNFVPRPNPADPRLDPLVRPIGRNEAEFQPGGSPGNGYQNINVFTDSQAVFGHLTYALNDNWDLELGTRWTEDDRSFSIVEFESGLPCLYGAQASCSPSPVLNAFNVFQNGFFNELQETFDAVTSLISISYISRRARSL